MRHIRLIAVIALTWVLTVGCGGTAGEEAGDQPTLCETAYIAQQAHAHRCPCQSSYRCLTSCNDELGFEPGQGVCVPACDTVAQTDDDSASCQPTGTACRWHPPARAHLCLPPHRDR